MTNQNKTTWFHSSVKPVRNGVYELGFKLDPEITPYPNPFHYWSRGAFGAPHRDAYCASLPDVANDKDDYLNGGFYWRGLTSPPKDAA